MFLTIKLRTYAKRNFLKIDLFICWPSNGVIPKTLKMVLDTYMLNTQQYKVRIKGKVE